MRRNSQQKLRISSNGFAGDHKLMWHPDAILEAASLNQEDVAVFSNPSIVIEELHARAVLKAIDDQLSAT